MKPAARTLNKHNNDTAVCYSRHFRNRMHVLIIIRSTRQSKQISSNKTYGAMLTQLPQIEATSQGYKNLYLFVEWDHELMKWFLKKTSTHIDTKIRHILKAEDLC